MNTELPRNTIYITVQKFAGGKIFCSTLYISAMPSFVKIIVNKTPVNASTVPAFESQLSNHLFYRVRLSPLLFVPLCPMYLLLLFLPLWKSFHNPFIKFIYCSHIITSSPIIIDRCLLLTTERCVIIRAAWELQLPVYHNFIQFYRRFPAFITAQYINPPIIPPSVL